MNYHQLAQTVGDELKKLEKINNWLELYDKEMLYADRFVFLVKNLLTEKDDTEEGEA